MAYDKAAAKRRIEKANIRDFLNWAEDLLEDEYEYAKSNYAEAEHAVRDDAFGDTMDECRADLDHWGDLYWGMKAAKKRLEKGWGHDEQA